MSRRDMLAYTGLLSAAAAGLFAPGALRESWTCASTNSAASTVEDALNGLLAFVVPGQDAFSVSQGVVAAGPGGVEAGVLAVLSETLDASAPYQPVPFSFIVAGILNDLANAVRPGVGGFAALTFAEKIAVFQIMDSTEPLKILAGVLPAFTAFLGYSEAGVLDPETRTLTGVPVGWTISGYEGVAEGRDEFRGYYREPGPHQTEESAP